MKMNELVTWFQKEYPELVADMRECSHHGEHLNPYHEEGYVVRLASGERVKFKSEEYLALARIMSNMSPLTFWSRMEYGKIDREFLEQLPEEFRDECDEIADTLERQYGELQQATYYEFSSIAVELGLGKDLQEDRKKLGIYLKENRVIHAPAMFPYLLQNGPDQIDKYIMKQIKPVGNILRDI